MTERRALRLIRGGAKQPAKPSVKEQREQAKRRHPAGGEKVERPKDN